MNKNVGENALQAIEEFEKKMDELRARNPKIKKLSRNLLVDLVHLFGTVELDDLYKVYACEGIKDE